MDMNNKDLGYKLEKYKLPPINDNNVKSVVDRPTPALEQNLHVSSNTLSWYRYNNMH